MRAWSWLKNYAKTSVWHAIQIIGLALLVLVIIVEATFFASIWYGSLQSGLTIYAEPTQEDIRVTSGEEYEVAFRVGVTNAPFCVEMCTYTLTDQRSGENITGTIHNPQAAPQEMSFPMRSPQSGAYTSAHQLIVTCSNQPTARCQRPTDVATQTALVRVNHERAADQQEAYDTLAQIWGVVLGDFTNTLSRLQGIIAVEDVRAVQIVSQATQEYAQVRAQLRSFEQAIKQEDYLTALNHASIAPTPSIASYNQTRAAEHEAADVWNALITQQTVAHQAIYFMSEQAYRDYHSRITQSVQIRDRFFEVNPLYARDVFIAAQQLPSTNISIANEAQQAMHDEQLRICNIKNGVCPQPVNHSQTLSQAYDALNASCTFLQDIDTHYAQAHTRLVDELNLTESQAATIIQTTRQDPTFPQQEQQALTSNQPVQNDSVRLAITLTPLPQTIQSQQACAVLNRTLPTITSPLNATLPDQPYVETTVNITLPQRQCCAGGVCVTCGQEQRIPILFVHGHSFAEKTAPEYSLQAFSTFALELQEEGILHAGAVFPRERITPNALANIPGGVSITTTYYYDGFAEQGEVQFVTRKTERIESYAIRLRETIRNVKELTGQDEVIIVAHSMGGLVTRSYMEIFGDDDLAGVVMIGTPNNGITRLVDRVCPLIGADFECEDMRQGSLYLRRLAQAPAPSIPVLTIAGTGCDGAFDGVVEVDSVALPYATNTVINGTCPTSDILLHNRMLHPEEYPEVYNLTVAFIEEVR